MRCQYRRRVAHASCEGEFTITISILILVQTPSSHRRSPPRRLNDLQFFRSRHSDVPRPSVAQQCCKDAGAGCDGSTAPRALPRAPARAWHHADGVFRPRPSARVSLPPNNAVPRYHGPFRTQVLNPGRTLRDRHATPAARSQGVIPRLGAVPRRSSPLRLFTAQRCPYGACVRFATHVGPGWPFLPPPSLLPALRASNNAATAPTQASCLTWAFLAPPRSSSTQDLRSGASTCCPGHPRCGSLRSMLLRLSSLRRCLSIVVHAGTIPQSRSAAPELRMTRSQLRPTSILHPRPCQRRRRYPPTKYRHACRIHPPRPRPPRRSPLANNEMQQANHAHNPRDRRVQRMVRSGDEGRQVREIGKQSIHCLTHS